MLIMSRFNIWFDINHVLLRIDENSKKKIMRYNTLEMLEKEV